MKNLGLQFSKFFRQQTDCLRGSDWNFLRYWKTQVRCFPRDMRQRHLFSLNTFYPSRFLQKGFPPKSVFFFSLCLLKAQVRRFPEASSSGLSSFWKPSVPLGFSKKVLSLSFFFLFSLCLFKGTINAAHQITSGIAQSA